MLNKAFFLGLLMLISIQAPAQRPQVKVDCKIYQVVYSEVYEQPLSVSYKITCIDGKTPRKGLDFYTNDSIKTSDNRDYEGNVWDKGHLAPAAHFNCELSTLKTTFSYLNCALQHEALNRGAWRLLEAYERNLSKTEKDVSVLITLDFSFFDRLPTGGCVPKGFTKTIYVAGKPFECYYFPNTDPKTNDFKKFLVKNCK